MRMKEILREQDPTLGTKKFKAYLRQDKRTPPIEEIRPMNI